MAAIFVLSSIPGESLPLPDFRFSDKLAHFTAYASLGAALALRRTLRSRLAGPGRTSAPDGFDRTGVLIGILYGLSDEVHQVFVPMRQFSVSDLAADALGVVAGIGIYGWFSRRREAS